MRFYFFCFSNTEKFVVTRMLVYAHRIAESFRKAEIFTIFTIKRQVAKISSHVKLLVIHKKLCSRKFPAIRYVDVENQESMYTELISGF